MKNLIFLAILFFGHFSLLAQWQQTSGPEGGIAFCIDVIDGVLWGGTTSGIYQSADNGTTWTHSDIVAHDIEVHEINHSGDEIYIVAYDPALDFLVDSQWAVLISKDKGLTWESHSLPIFWEPIIPFGNQKEVFRIGDAIYTTDGYFIVKLKDNDTTWTDISYPTMYYEQFVHDGNNFLINATDSLFISTDQGTSWSFLNKAPTDYFSSIYLEDSLIILTHIDNIYISHDLGSTYSAQAMFFLAFDGRPYCKKLSDGCIYFFNSSFLVKSCDDGDTWEVVSASGLDVIANDNRLIFTKKSGFSIYENDITTSSNTGYLGASAYKVLTSSNGKIYISSGTSSAVLFTENNGVTWNELLREDGQIVRKRELVAIVGDTLVLLRNDDIILSINGIEASVLNTDHFGRQLWVNDQLLVEYSSFDKLGSYSLDLGTSWQPITLPIGNEKRIENFKSYQDHWIIKIRNNNNQTLIYTSNNHGTSWTQTSDFPTIIVDGVFFENGYQNGKISYDYGLTWHDYLPIGCPDDQLPFKIVSYNNVWYGLIHNNGVYISTDQGATWSPFNDGLTAMIGRDIAVADDGTVYLGTGNQGCWMTNADYELKSGYTYLDMNNNGVADIGEPPLKDVLISTNHTYAKSNSSGQFSIFTDAAVDSLKGSYSIPYAIFNPSGYAISSAMDGYDFGIYLDPNHNDLKIDITASTVFRPGFTNALNLNIKNIGTTIQKPTVSLNLMNHLTYMSATPAPSATVNGVITWELDSLAILDIDNISVIVKTNQSAPIGDTVQFAANVEPIANDESPDNNVINFEAIIVGSYDPNDKAVDPSTNYLPDYLAEKRPLKYTIRFQNTGNFQADNIRITDTISPYLDLSTIELISSSHPVEWLVRGEGAIEFKFNSINLPDSTANELMSHGYVKYSILPKPNLPLGTPIENTAFIYFDFNDPIVTNTTETKFDHLVGVWSLTQKVNKIDIQPNPATDFVKLQLKRAVNGPGEVEIYNTTGQKIFSTMKTISNGQLTLDLPNWPTGNYLIRLAIGDEVYAGKIILGK